MTIRIHWRGWRNREPGRLLRWAAAILFAAGCLALGLCAVVYFQAGWFQASEGKLFEKPKPIDSAARDALSLKSSTSLPPANYTPVQEGSPLSKIEIPRLGISVVVIEGVRARSLRLGVGHVPGTALPGETGNVAIAGHRDTFFRKLGQIRTADRITLDTLRGSFVYSVESMQVVEPGAVEVLRPSEGSTLTLITCYPFSYVGPAPKRFIVKARRENLPQDLPARIANETRSTF